MTDVVISGAGPVGLFLACELALAKCSVLVLEKADDAHSALKKRPFGIRGLSAPSIEALDRRGLLEKLEIHKHLKSPHANAGSGALRQKGHFAGIPLLEGHIDVSKWKYRLPSSTETSLISEMEELETVFSSRAKELGVEIKRGLAVTDFQQTKDGVTVQSGNRSFEARWLVGCDGARSIVRKLGGFEFAGTEPEFTGYTTLMEIADPEKLKAGRNVTSRGMYMQSQPGYVMIQDFDGGAFHDSKKPITLEHVQEMLRRISETDVTIKALRVATTWTDRARQATSYRNRRVLLAGDAAHIHSPLGGQGLNLGLGDAMNLGWKLAAAIHDKAPQGLLDTYQTERHPIGEKVLDWSRAQVAIMRPTPEGRALHAIFRDLIGTRDGATYFAGRMWGVHTHYDLGGAGGDAGDERGLVGRSVPNFEFEDGTTVDELLREGGGVLLDFARDRVLTDVAKTWTRSVQYVVDKPKDDLGLKALLVRPDGIVAWVAAAESIDRNQITDSLSRWFRRD